MSEKTFVTLADLMALPDVTELTEDVVVPGLGTVRLRALSLQEHREIRDDCAKADPFDMDRFEALLLSRCLVEPVISYDDAVKLRATKALGVIERLVGAAARACRLTSTGEISAAAVEAAEATFPDEPNEGVDLRTG